MSDTLSAEHIGADDGKRYVVVTSPHVSLKPGDEVAMSEAYCQQNIFIRVSDLTLHGIVSNGIYVTVREIEARKPADKPKQPQDERPAKKNAEIRS